MRIDRSAANMAASLSLQVFVIVNGCHIKKLPAGSWHYLQPMQFGGCSVPVYVDGCVAAVSEWAGIDQ